MASNSGASFQCPIREKGRYIFPYPYMAVVTDPSLDPMSVRIPPHPPSERGNLVLQIATDQVRFNEVQDDILLAHKHYGDKPQRIFLAGGRNLTLPTDKLLNTVACCFQAFPHLERVSIYRNARRILARDETELKLLKQAGLHKIYTRLQTDDEDPLRCLNMEMTVEEFVEMAASVKAAEIELSLTVRLGLGGAGSWARTAARTAMILNRMQPPEIRLHHLIVQPHSPLSDSIAAGEFIEASRYEILKEMHELVRLIEYPTRIHTHRLLIQGLPIERKIPEEQDQILKVLAFALYYFYGENIAREEIEGYSVVDILEWDGVLDA